MNNDIKIFGGMILATVILIIGAVFFIGRGDNSGQAGQNAKPTVVPRNVLVQDDSWAVGSPSAKVVVVEFGDFQCPSCKAEEPVVKQLLAHYGDDIYFVYRHFPLAQIHQYALPAADAAEAAGMQGKFWEYHDKLYEISPGLTKENLLKIAKDLKLDEEKFAKDLESDAARQQVLDDMAAGTKVNVSGTPTFFINGKAFQLGHLPTLSDFKSEIDPLLK